ncbi:MAG: bifunctional phosphopantothenoylcysteine decarboxylase/phosphopantothenate--cysteine ligase CoaBC [Candidatus Marinimicrobia bacterium]|nr:bifunctional phosphopantothenoylcysteine decarboxylase/phosphopantothenate--cysteine ligase CoaBC [Candidatus Neomarinimicrobiota bacterium]
MNKLNTIRNKKILICVTGSIAVYKTCELVRQLRKEDAIVQVMMTKSALEFVGKATFAALTNNEVLTDIFPNTPKAGLEHIELAMDVDAIIVCPATANNLCKVANGIADDLISTTLSVCEQPTLFVPAMNFRMWRNEGTINAVKLLRESGKMVMNPESGQLASLHKGIGRLPEILSIMNGIRNLFNIPLPLKGKKVLITAGPTREWIDPVRYISNRSSGKMGFALAKSARDKGAEVVLISGPVSLNQISGIHTIPVETSDEMLNAIQIQLEAGSKIDYLFMCSAVSDYKLKNISLHKIKRKDLQPSLEIIPAPDILKSISTGKDTKIIAFALETEYNKVEALRKLKDKKADFIAMNITQKGISGFDSETNELFIFNKAEKIKKLELNHKSRIASQLIDYVISDN